MTMATCDTLLHYCLFNFQLFLLLLFAAALRYCLIFKTKKSDFKKFLSHLQSQPFFIYLYFIWFYIKSLSLILRLFRIWSITMVSEHLANISPPFSPLVPCLLLFAIHVSNLQIPTAYFPLHKLTWSQVHWNCLTLLPVVCQLTRLYTWPFALERVFFDVNTTFQHIKFVDQLVNIQRKRSEHEKSFCHYFCFISFIILQKSL